MGINRKISTCLLVSLLCCPVIFAPFTLDQHLAIRSLLLSLCLLAAYCFLSVADSKINVRFDLILLSKILYTVFCVASIAWATNKPEAIYSGSKDVLALLFFLASVFALTRDTAFFMKALFVTVSVVLVLTALMAGLQFFTADKTNPQWIYKLTGINAHKNLCASFIYLLFFTLGISHIETKKLHKGIYITCILLCLLLIILLRSKAVFAAFLMAGLVYLIHLILTSVKTATRSSLQIVWINTAIALLFFLLVFPSILRTPADNNFFVEKLQALDSERWVLWQKSFGMFWKHPWFGVGAGNWQIFFPAEGLHGIWRSEDLNVSFQRPHNDFLWVLSEKGILGFCFFLFFLCGLISFLLNGQVSKNTGNAGTGSRLVLPAIAGWLVISFCDFPAERIEHIMFSNLIFAIGYVQVKKTLPEVFSFHATKASFFLLPFILIICCVISWQRVAGEKNTMDLYTAKTKGDLKEIHRSAEKALSFAYDLDPTTIPIRWYTGSAYAAEGDYQKSLKHFEEAFQSHPFQRNVLNDLGTSYVLNGNSKKGELYYIMATQISPRFDDPKLNLAAIYLGQRRFALANYWLVQLLHPSKKRSEYEKILYYETEGKFGRVDN